FENLKNIALDSKLDRAVKIDTITQSLKANEQIMEVLAGFATNNNLDKMVNAFVECMVDLYMSKEDLESVIDDFNKGRDADKQVKDTSLFADKYACAKGISLLQGRQDLEPHEQELLTKLREEYFNILQQELASGIELSGGDKQYLEDYKKSKHITPSHDNGPQTYTYDLGGFEDGYDEWKTNFDKLARHEKLDPKKEEHEKKEAATKAFAEKYVPQIVAKVQELGQKFNDADTPNGANLTDKERAFLGANAELIDTKGFDKTQHNDFSKGVLAHAAAGKAIPNITATKEIVQENGVDVAKYTYSIQSQKTYDELFPSTDISSKIAKTVKDLKDAYVYLKPGIKLCDKLIDYIKGLTFNTENTYEAPVGTDTGNGNGQGNGGNTTPTAPTDDNAKILALLKEITDKLADLEKAVKLATNGIESSKIDAMQKDGDVYGKLIEAYSLINKEGQDPKITQAHTPAYAQCQGIYQGLHNQLMGMGQMQIPVQPIGNGMYAIPGNMLGFMAAANFQMYGAPFANFMGLDPQMYSKMYAQMRPSYTTSITVVTNQGVKVDLKVKLAAGLVNDSQVNLFKKDIHDHVYNFIETSSTDLNAIRGDLMAYLEELLPGSTIESTSLTNFKTGEKQEITAEELEAEGEVKGKVDPKKTPVKPAVEKEHAPKPRFDFVIDDKTATLSVLENGNVVATKVLDKKLTPAEKAYLRNELNEIEKAEFKSPQEEQFFFNSMFDKLLEKDAGLEQ
ncbi:MAG: hypothetical protein J6V40_01105, partial [Clostridia bacterium]|nr:hypothetical protein [Clostridia bacterium]